MKFSLVNAFVFLLIIWSIIYIFFSHRFGKYGARWTTEVFSKREGYDENIGEGNAHELIFGESSLKPPPQIGVNYTHDHPLHKDTYKYLSDMEISLDKLSNIQKSKPPAINPKTVKLSTGLNPYEYAQWQQVLPEVFSQPLYGEKCPAGSSKDDRLRTAMTSVQCKAPSVQSQSLSEFNPYLSEAPQNGVSGGGKNGGPGQNIPIQNGGHSMGKRNMITINVDDHRGGKKSKQEYNDDDNMMGGRVGKVSKPPSKGYSSFNQTNDVKWEAKNNDKYGGGPDTGIERPG